MTTAVPPPDLAEPTLLERYLAAADDPCPMCGYNLHNLRGTLCPECGQELRLTIALVEPRAGLYTAGIVGLACGIGFTGFVFIWGLYSFLRIGGPEPGHLVLLLIELTVLAGLLVGWIRFARWVKERRKPWRIVLATGTWLLSFAAAVIFIAVARY